MQHEPSRHAVIGAFELCRTHGMTEALKIAEQRRDQNAQGTVSFSMHNETCKVIRQFIASGSMYRPA